MVSCKDNHNFKEAAYDKLVTNVIAIDTKIPSTSSAVTKTQYEKQIEDVVKKIPRVVDFSIRLITTQKSQKLLQLHSLQKPKILKAKYSILLI